MTGAAGLQPRAGVGSMPPLGVSKACRVARVPMRPLRQPVRCAAEHLQAAVDAATTAPDALAASGPSLLVQLVVSAVTGYPTVSVAEGINEHFQRKADAETFERLKAAARRQGCHPRLLARLDSMSASEFFEAANSKSGALLIDKWEAEACEVSMLAAADLHGALVHFAGWAAG